MRSAGTIELPDEQEMKSSLYQTALKDSLRKARKVPVSKKPKRQQLYFLYKMIMNRKNLEYTFKNALVYNIWFLGHLSCCPCRSKKSIKKLKAPI